ncbi:integrase catalytic domain-containing protein [Trichonephila clavipes]|nr:integrase catalytic domain-containing protein [Trichonephila clavipes]
MDKKSKNKNNSNVTTEEKLNRLKDSIKGTLTRLEAFTSEKTVSKDTSVTEIEIKLKKIEQLQINLDKIAEDYCEIEIFESLEIIQLDIEDINQRIETTEIKTHGFSNASERAYAAVVYIKCFNESGQSQTRLLCSKPRVAPLKTLTIPRFINNIKSKEFRNKGKYLIADEIKRSTEFLAKIAQLSEFKAEIDALKKGKGVSKTSILNSRPLVPLSDIINEYEVLTPGHFIIGRPISAIPEPAILDISDNRLSRWQYTNKVCTNSLETLEK